MIKRVRALDGSISPGPGINDCNRNPPTKFHLPCDSWCLIILRAGSAGVVYISDLLEIASSYYRLMRFYCSDKSARWLRPLCLNEGGSMVMKYEKGMGVQRECMISST